MRKIMKTCASLLFAVCLIQTSLVGRAWAQNDSGAQAADGSPDRPHLSGTRKQIAIIIFSGLAGGVLGLSTLSFYGRPQDHLSNIAFGFAVGIITGTIYTTYNAATRPYETFDQDSADLYNDPLAPQSESALRAQEHPAFPLFAYNWSF